MTSSSVLNIVVADDHPLIVEGLVEKIRQRGGMNVVGTYFDPNDLINEYGRLLPSVVVMDLYYGENRCRGVDAIRTLRSKFPESKIVVFSQADQLTLIREAYGLGILAYVTKDAKLDVLWDAVTHAAANSLYYTPDVARRFAVQATLRESPLDALSLRERQVFELAAGGKSNPEIAQHLGIAVRSAANLRVAVKTKLDAKSNSDLTMIALSHKLIEAPAPLK